VSKKSPIRDILLPGLAFFIGLAVFSFLLFNSCTEDPIKIGQIAGLSGRGADYGIGGRNGATLAVEQKNRAGGINGRPIQLLSRDDQQDPEVAQRAFTDLLGQGVTAVIGPMTSAMATAIVPLANEHEVLLVSPTVTTDFLSGIDDYFYRVISPNKVYAEQMARHMREVLNIKRVGVIYDLGNAAYTESWLESFQDEFLRLGGQIVFTEGFTSGPDVRFFEMSRRALNSRPDGLLSISGAMDTAMFCQQVRKLNSSVVLGAPDWSATEKLMDLGGRAVEGVLVGQFFDPSSTSREYLEFRNAYQARFNTDPGLPAVTAYDAANFLFTALEIQSKGEPLKETLKNIAMFQGVQGAVALDPHGDARRETLITIVKNGRFQKVE